MSQIDPTNVTADTILDALSAKYDLERLRALPYDIYSNIYGLAFGPYAEDGEGNTLDGIAKAVAASASKRPADDTENLVPIMDIMDAYIADAFEAAQGFVGEAVLVEQ